MRDRLIELLKKADKNASNKFITDYDDAITDNAEYLIANGVIVPPCKVGDVIFRLDKADVERPIKMCVIDEIRINKYGTAVVIVDAYLPLRRAYPSACIGKTVFLTREDAKKALEEMNNV